MAFKTIESFAEAVSEVIDSCTGEDFTGDPYTGDYNIYVDKVGDLLASLSTDKEWLRVLLRSYFFDLDFVKDRSPSLEMNELFVYRSPDKKFSVRIYYWSPDRLQPIHDHSSWGLAGVISGNIQERRFVLREPEEVTDTFAEVIQTECHVLSPAGVSMVRPLEQGIHQMHALGGVPAMSVHVYGHSERKGFINTFNAQNGLIERIYSPTFLMQMNAIRCAKLLDEDWAKDSLITLRNKTDFDFLQALAVE